MAITRAQIAKQLLSNGGRIGFFKGAQADASAGKGAMSPGTSMSGGARNAGFNEGNTNRERGIMKSMKEAQARADARVAAGLGDPDPEVDIPTKDREDTITSFEKNLRANLIANPFSLITPLGTFLQTAYQTNKARSMLGLKNPTPQSPPGEGVGGEGPIPYWAQLGFSSEAEYLAALARGQTPSTEEQEPETEEPQGLEGLRLRFRAEGGRIKAQEGGIMPRLNQLGSGVSSAEQMLQGINQRLQSAESSLGGGGGLRVPEGTIPTDTSAFKNIFQGNMSPPRPGAVTPLVDNMGFNFRQPGDMGRYIADNDPGGIMAGYSSYQDYLNAGNDPVERKQGPQPLLASNQFSQVTPPQTPVAMQTPISGIPAAGYADGGNVVGGEFDFESARQMYGLGKLVKKIGRTVKKVAKSPIGKAALLYAAGSLGMAGLGQYRAGTGIFSPTGFLKSKALPFLVGRPESIISPLGQDIFKQAATKGILGAGGKLSIGKAITAASLLPLLGIGTGDESEEEAQAILDQSGLDLDAIRANPNKYLATAFKAEGGRIGYDNGSSYTFDQFKKDKFKVDQFMGEQQMRKLYEKMMREKKIRDQRNIAAEGGSIKEPVAKKTMPLLDMGGQEMDLRAEGGFVPIGRMEKADDVPARLSKNEFVFTAEAVRNAGEGDVDKGAEVMYNMMKNLEAGGDVSKESQGLEGARRMFQTSQRLEEVL